MKYQLSEHAEKRMQERDISLEEVNTTLNKGKEYKSKLHGGQLRYYYGGICVIVRKSSDRRSLEERFPRDLILTAYKLNHR